MTTPRRIRRIRKPPVIVRVRTPLLDGQLEAIRRGMAMFGRRAIVHSDDMEVQWPSA